MLHYLVFCNRSLKVSEDNLLDMTMWLLFSIHHVAQNVLQKQNKPTEYVYTLISVFWLTATWSIIKAFSHFTYRYSHCIICSTYLNILKRLILFAKTNNFQNSFTLPWLKQINWHLYDDSILILTIIYLAIHLSSVAKIICLYGWIKELDLVLNHKMIKICFNM